MASIHDENHVPNLVAVSNADGTTPVNVWADPTTHRLLVNLPSGSGTVTSVSVVSANGLAGTVATATTTPAITLSTTVTGIVKGNGTALSAAVAETDYVTPTGTGTLSNKTLTTPVISSISNTGTLTLPTSTDTLVGRATTDTLTNKSLSDTTTNFIGAVDATKKLNVSVAGQSTATTGVLASSFTTGKTLTLPDATDTLVGKATTDTLTNKTLTTPVINGTATGTGVSATPTASILAMFDANKNLSANNLIDGFTTTATAAGTTTLTIASTGVQVFTGTTTQTVVLPTTSVVAGAQYTVVNQSTGAVTVQSSGLNTITILAANTSATFTAVIATPTTAANWNSQYLGSIITSGKSLSASSTLTLAGTDATTITFQGTDTYVGRATTDILTNKTLDTAGAGNVLKINGTQVSAVTGTGSVVLATSPTLTTPNIGAATATSLNAAVNTSINLVAGTYNTIQTYTPAAAGTATLDLSKGNIHHITMPAGNITIAISNGTAGQCFIVRILQDATGSRTVTWFTTIKWAGGTAPTLTTTASKADTMGFEITGTGTYDGFVVGQAI